LENWDPSTSAGHLGVAIPEFNVEVTDNNGLQIVVKGGENGSDPWQSDAWTAALEIISRNPDGDS